MKIDKQTMRENNKSLVIEEIFKNKIISRAKLSQLTKLNKATMSKTIGELIEEGIVLESGVGISNSQGGRKPILLELNQQRGLIISVELDFNRYSYSVHLFDGKIIEFKKFEENVNKNNVIKIVTSIIDTVKNGANNDTEIIGICIAVHGIIEDNKTKFSPKYDLDQIDLSNKLSELYDFPVYLVNEANASAIFESNYKHDIKNSINLNINSGIGAGIFMHGELLTGSSGLAGEVGHSIYQPNGYKCQCGNFGCIELYASNKVLEDKVLELLKWSKIDYIELPKQFKNNENLRSLIETNAQILSVLANNLIVLLSPELLIFNSSIIRALPEMLNIIKANIKNQYLKNTKIMISEFGEYSTLYGCYSIVIKNYLSINKVYLNVSN